MPSPLPLHDIVALRALEARAIAASGGDESALMARAGQAGWRCVLQHWPHARRIAVACGPGNNGGDGYVLARHALEAGREVHVLRLQAPGTAVAQRACDDFLAAGGRIVEPVDGLRDAGLIVDALFGIGLSRAPDGAAAALIDAINAHPAPVLALDVPSGVDAANGAAHPAAIVADRTLQFIARHRGLRTGAALDHAGALELATLELPAAVFEGIAPAALAYRADALPGLFPLRPRDSHKGGNGHVLCIGGDHGSGGAIEDAAQLAPLLQRADVVAIGPGLGQGAWGRALLDAVLACDTPRVLDADALNLLAHGGQRLDPHDVITPHPGEAARLLGIDTADVQRDRFAAARELQERMGTHVVLKGAGSIVASPGRVPAVVCAGNPGMATGGMGDLLTGCIAALVAQGFAAGDAAVAGALLHAGAGDAAVRDEGERGLLPSDLLPWLRRLANPMRR